MEKRGVGREWQEKKASLGQNKKIPDAKIGGISETLKVGEQKAKRARQYLVISILYHSQTAINKLVKMDKSASQALKIKIHQRAGQLIQQGMEYLFI